MRVAWREHGSRDESEVVGVNSVSELLLVDMVQPLVSGTLGF